MKELAFIESIARKFKARKPVVLGIGDDCAVINHTKDKYFLLTSDMIVEGTHFAKDTAPFQIGWKAAASNISDIASMGGTPKFLLVSLGIPKGKSRRLLNGIMDGIDAICKRYSVQVVGGDTNASKYTIVSISMIGEVRKKNLVKRNGARKGDLVFVTGALGEGKEKHLTFHPRLSEAKILVDNFRINSMIDLSDGLATDLYRITQASNVGACIYKSLIPLSNKSVSPDKSIYQGEDFELLFTLSLSEAKRLMVRMGRKNDLPVSLIGEILPKPNGIILVEEEGRAKRIKPKGYRHL